MKVLFVSLLLWVANSVYADDIRGQKFLLQYEGEQHYLVTFLENELRWECVKGDELGRSEIDPFESREIASKIFFIHWSEKDGSFVDLVLNLNSMKVWSSGQSGESKWFRDGVISPIQS
jgi:hypothetical protein